MGEIKSTRMDIRSRILARRQALKNGTLQPLPPPPPDWIPPPPPPPPIRETADIPPDAVKLVPEEITSPIFYIPSSGRVLKVGYHVRVAEAEAMRFVARTTSIPVPAVHEAYEKDGIGYIYMSKAEGVRLGSVWESLPAGTRGKVVSQLQKYIQELGQVVGDFYGGIGRLGCEDVFFHHLCVAHAKEHNQHPYGPFESREEYNEGLVQALYNSRPPGEFSARDEELVAQVRSLTGEEKVFSHGDLHLDNIYVDEEGGLSIIDWGNAGFSIPQRDYFEARLRSRTPSWNDALEHIFPEGVKKDFEFLKRYNYALVEYSGL